LAFTIPYRTCLSKRDSQSHLFCLDRISELTSGEDLSNVLDSKADQVMEDSEGKSVPQFIVKMTGTKTV
jgi:hypothetical protein